MNERYTSEERKGSSRKSAASAKPVMKAASSVHIQTNEKTKAEKKADRRVERSKRRERESQFYNPPTARYKQLRRYWWICLVAAIVLTVVSFAGQQYLPQTFTYVTLGLAYVFIIAALYIDFSKCRKERQRYADEVASHKTKEQRAAEKRERAEARAARANAEATTVQKKPSFLEKLGFGGKKKPAKSDGDGGSKAPSAAKPAKPAKPAKSAKPSKK